MSPAPKQLTHDRPIDAIALIGPTASGKTAAALALAHTLEAQGGAEIISLDSALVYHLIPSNYNVNILFITNRRVKNNICKLYS